MQLSAVPNQMGNGVGIDIVGTRVQAGWSGFWFLAGQEFLSSPKWPVQFWGPNILRWVLEMFSRGVKWPVCEVLTDLP